MPQKTYDVLIVGSSHSGGTAAYVLAQKGLSVLILNAGPVVDLARDRTPLRPHELPYRGLKNLGAPSNPPVDEFQANGFVDRAEVPYTFDADRPFVWVRSRIAGGRSYFWSRNSHRLSNFEFKQKDYDGVGENWPITHEDLAPYYEKMEAILRVVGKPEGLPQWPDSKFVEVDPPQEPSQVMKRFMDAGAKRGIRVSNGRRAMGANGLAGSVNLLLPDAFATGNLTLVPNAVVRELSVDRNTGLVNGAYFVDRHTRREMHAKAKVVVLGASSYESVRILLNSKIANSSGVLGHYLFDQVYSDTLQGYVPEAMNGKGAATPGLIGGSGLIPPYRNVGPGTKGKNFAGRYALNISCGGTPPDDVLGAYGDELEKKRTMYQGAGFNLSMLGEVIPRFENHCRINPDVKDPWGIPVLHFSTKYGENELNMQHDAQESMLEVMHECGIELLHKSDLRREFGQSTHEIGGCRMGDNPKTSVLNKWSQSHDVRNLYVVDGSQFATGGWQNPTLTIVALAYRAAEHLSEQFRTGTF